MAWQSGLTGVGWNTEKVSAPIAKLDDLMNPDIVGTDSVGMITGDMGDLVMVNLGITPADSGPDEWREAAAWLEKLKQSGTLRKFYDQGYVDDFTVGTLAASMAWSGDILYYKIWEDRPFEFGVPEGGALLWIDNMLIPANSANPQGAYQLMDHVYQPEIAQMITEWVLYMSPVPAVQDLIAEHAAQEKGELAADLQATADSEFLWPDDALLARTPFGRNLTTDEEREEWDNIFIPVSET
jgi:spermidine/putrescine transport system substrate-binding protein